MALPNNAAPNTQRPDPHPGPSPSPLENEKKESNENNPAITSLYLKYAEETDSALMNQYNADMDILLLFATLFSAIVTSFVLQSFNDVQEDYAQTSANLLNILVLQSLGQTADITLPPPFVPARSAVVASSLWVCSLVISLCAALLGIMCKQWLRGYSTGVSPIPSARAQQRHSRHAAFDKWKISYFVAVLPITLHVAAILFFAGLAEYLNAVDETVLIVALVMVCASGLTYFTLSVLPFITDAPFHTPMTILVLQSLTRFLVSILMSFLIYLAFAFAFIYQFFSPGQGTLAKARRNVKASRVSFDRYFRSMRISFSGKIDPSWDVTEEKITTADLISWLIRCPLPANELQMVVKSISGIKGQRSQQIFEESGTDMMLLHQMESSCFTQNEEDTQLTPEQVPLAILCISSWLDIITSGTGTPVAYFSPFLVLKPEQIIKSLRAATEGFDQIKVDVASMWWTRDWEEGRSMVERHLQEHIKGTTELPDDIIRILVVHPHPWERLSPILIELLQEYSNREAPPPAECTSAILLTLCNLKSPLPYGRRTSPAHMISTLTHETDVDKFSLLRLVRSLWRNDPQIVADSDLATTLIGMLNQTPPPEQALTEEILLTISAAPDCCIRKKRALTDLTQAYRRYRSSALSLVSVRALAALTQSILHPKSKSQYASSEQTLKRELRDVAQVMSYTISGSNVDEEFVFPAIYTLSMIWGTDDCSRHAEISPPDFSALTRALHLSTIHLTLPRQYSTLHHIFLLMTFILYHDMTHARSLLQSMALWETLLTSDTPLIRWRSLSILKYVAYYLPRQERQRLYGMVRDDIATRLASTAQVPFLDNSAKFALKVRALEDENKKIIDPVLIGELEADIQASGIDDLLKSAPPTSFCAFSSLDNRGFPWISDLDLWLRENPVSLPALPAIESR